MTTDFLVQRLQQCSRTSKLDCMETVQHLLELSFFYRDHTFVELDLYIRQQGQRYQDPFLRKAISCLVDLSDVELIRTVLENYIISGNYTGELFLRCLVVSETVQALHRKVDLDHIFSFLVPSLFGLEFEADIVKMYRNFAQVRIHSEPETAAPAIAAKLGIV